MFEELFQISLKMIEDQYFNGENKLSGFFKRLEAIMIHYNIASVNELAIKHLNYDSSQKINRLKKEGTSPSAEIIADIIEKWPEINANWLLTGTGAMIIGIPNKFEDQPRKEEKEPSMKDVLMVIAEGYKAQVETVKNIESGMARERTLANVAANSIEILAGVRSLSKRQKSVMKEIQQGFELLKSHTVPQSQDSNRNLGRNGGEAKKRGKTR